MSSTIEPMTPEWGRWWHDLIYVLARYGLVTSADLPFQFGVVVNEPEHTVHTPPHRPSLW